MRGTGQTSDGKLIMQGRTAAALLAVAIVCAFVIAATQPAQAQTFKLLYNFTGGTDGGNPYAGLVMDKSGVLYGATEAGGASGDGTVYSFSKGTETVLHSFSGTDGAQPFAGVVMDSSGTLYGTTTAGGSSDMGTVFALDSSGTFTTLYNFTGGSDGGPPYAGLVLDKKGNVYGTTAFGGSAGDGVVFKVNIGTQQETVLYNFCSASNCADGSTPFYGYPLMDAKANLYGTTWGGGSSGYGTVWELSAKGKETVLYSFKGGTDGNGVYEQSLAMDKSGNLYGTTEWGGTGNCSGGCGVVYRVNIKTKKETVLYSFPGPSDGLNGVTPSSGVIRDSSGTLYGTTQGGGGFYDYGTVFKIVGKKESILHRFDGTDGNHPFTSPLLDEKGTLYGSAHEGGTYGYGTIYSLKP